jgi:uncharacterized protein
MIPLLSGVALFQLAAQQTNTDQKPVEQVKAKAEAGDADSQCELGRRYDKGEGVAKDPVEAYKWWLLVAKQGDESGKEGVAMLEKELTSAQIANGQKRARDSKPK